MDMIIYADTPAEAIEAFRTYTPPPPKWGKPVPQRY